MSKDKHKAQQRITALLVRAGELGGALALNCEGGMAADDPTLCRAVALGLFRVERDEGRLSFNLSPVRRTYAVVTDAGLQRMAGAPESRENRHTTRWKMYWQRSPLC